MTARLQTSALSTLGHVSLLMFYSVGASWRLKTKSCILLNAWFHVDLFAHLFHWESVSAQTLYMCFLSVVSCV